MNLRRPKLSERSKRRGLKASPYVVHSYSNPAHEERLGQLLRGQFPEAYVSLSHEILREFREYERTSTNGSNSYVGPIVSRYLVSLEKLLGDSGFRGTFRVMQSNGGVMSAEMAKKMPVTMMESGPVAGVIAAADIGESLAASHHLVRHGWDHGQGESHQRLFILKSQVAIMSADTLQVIR